MSGLSAPDPPPASSATCVPLPPMSKVIKAASNPASAAIARAATTPADAPAGSKRKGRRGVASASAASSPIRSMASSMQRAMPRAGSSGVDGTFPTPNRPVASLNRQTSVKVAPESTPIRQAIGFSFLP